MADAWLHAMHSTTPALATRACYVPRPPREVQRTWIVLCSLRLMSSLSYTRRSASARLVCRLDSWTCAGRAEIGAEVDALPLCPHDSSCQYQATQTAAQCAGSSQQARHDADTACCMVLARSSVVQSTHGHAQELRTLSSFSSDSLLFARLSASACCSCRHASTCQHAHTDPLNHDTVHKSNTRHTA